MSCVVPGCRSGYHSSKLPEGVSSHVFPKDPGRRDQWIKAIPRKDWSPGKRSVVCSLHFEDMDFKVGRKDSNKRRKLGNLRIRCLKDDAVPRIFPNLPNYLTTHRPKERTSISTSASRFEAMELKVNEEAENFLRADKISTFEELKKSDAFNFPSSWNVVSHEISDRIIFDEVALNEDGKPTFKFSLTVQQNLQVLMFAKNIMISVKRILHICKSGKIERLSDVTNILAFLNSCADSPRPIEDTLEDYASRLEEILESSECSASLSLKLFFLTEQLKLLKGSPQSNRYSTSFLWTAITWQKTSPALYKLMREDRLFTLPCPSYLKQISNSFSLESGLSKATVAYLGERLRTVPIEDRSVALAIDEVFTAKRIEYIGGQFFGNENGAPTRTLLSFFASSLRGDYEDLICFIPMVNLNGKILMDHFSKVYQILEELGFDVTLVVTDGHKTNIKFFTDLGQGRMELKIEDFLDFPSVFFTMFDPVHLFKNFYHNFERNRLFLFPPIDVESEVLATASFRHLEEVFLMELHMPVKLAHKLSHKVLHPGPIERQNVKLAHAVFDESTINALTFYGAKGHPEFLGTAQFLRIIATWWKTANVKSKYHGCRKRDPDREPITKENLINKTSYFRGFVDWLCSWDKSVVDSKRKLSKETLMCSQHTSAALAELSEHLINEKDFEYFLTGKAQSDKIEKRFGKARQMTGGDLYASVRQFLETDRTLRVKNLAKLKKTMAEIKNIFSEANQDSIEKIEETAQKIVDSIFDDNIVEVSPIIPAAEGNVLFYVAGSFARSLCSKTNCLSCKEKLVPLNCESHDNHVRVTDESESVTDYFEQVNRGGLVIPSEIAFLTCVEAWKFYNLVEQNPHLNSCLHSANLPSRAVFQTAFVKYLKGSDETKNKFLIESCENGHSFQQFTISLTSKMFNLFSKNFASVLNSEIHSRKGRKSEDSKRDPLLLKVAKLQSEVV